MFPIGLKLTQIVHGHERNNMLNILVTKVFKTVISSMFSFCRIAISATRRPVN